MGFRLPEVLALAAWALANGGCPDEAAPAQLPPAPRRLDEEPPVDDVLAAGWSDERLAILWTGPAPPEADAYRSRQLGVSWFSTSGTWVDGWVLLDRGEPPTGALAASGRDLFAAWGDEYSADAAWLGPDRALPPVTESFPPALAGGWPGRSIATGSPTAAFVHLVESSPAWRAAFHVPLPSLFGGVLRPGETEPTVLWAAPRDPWPMGPPSIVAVDDGFLVAWSAWGGDAGTRVVAAPWSAGGVAGEPRDVWRGSPVEVDATLLPGRDGPFAIWIDATTREIRGRMLGGDGAPVAAAVGLGAFPGCTAGSGFRGASTDGDLMALHVDNPEGSCADSLVCLRADGSRLTAEPAPPPEDRRMLLAPSGPVVAVVEWPAERLAPGPVLLHELRCSGAPAPAPVREEPTSSPPTRADPGGSSYGRPRLAWNGSRFVLAAAGPRDRLAVTTVESDGTARGSWLALSGESPYLPAVAVGPDGRSLVAWTDAADGAAYFIVLGIDGRPVDTPRLAGFGADGPPAAAWTAHGAVVAWMGGATACRPMLARIDASLETAIASPVTGDAYRCATHRWPVLLGTDADRTWLLWAHDSGLDGRRVVVRLVEVGETELLGESLAEGDDLPEIIDSFGAPLLETDGSWTVPVWSWSAAGYEATPSTLALIVDPAGGAVWADPPAELSPQLLADTGFVPASWSLVDDGSARWSAAVGPLDAPGGSASGVFVRRVDGPPVPGSGYLVPANAPVVAGPQAVFAGDRLGVLWMEPGPEPEDPDGTSAVLRFALVPRSALP